MNHSRFARFSGVCALVGGCAWVAATLVHGSQPEGCGRDPCPIFPAPPERDFSTLGTGLFILGLVMLAASVAWLVLLMHQAGQLGRAGKVGATTCGVAAGSVVLGLLISPLLPKDFMPGFVLLFLLGLTIGVSLIGWAVLKSGLLPKWAGILLLLGVAPLFLANEQTDAVFFLIPLGVTWILVGVLLLIRTPGWAPSRGEHAAST
jgi:hypothetical protein